jgi:hypothetical protein
MATFQQQLLKAKKLTPKSQLNDLFRFIKSIEKEFLDRNRKQIKEDSKDIFGNPIGFYSYWTEVFTDGKKKQGDPFDGESTGKWLKGFYLEIDTEEGALRIFSKDPKTHDILESDNWLSDELFGLSDKNLKEVIRTRLLPFFIQNLRNKLDI